MTVGPLPRGGGPLRQRSRSEIRDPGSTSSSCSSTYRWPVESRPSSTPHNRRVVSSRTFATSRANVLTPGRHPLPELVFGVGELPPLADLADLPLVVEPRLRPLGVLLHLRRISDAELLGHEVQHSDRHIERIVQE